MKVVLFCGGLGTRLREHSDTIPKPLVNVGIRPLIWHLMRYYAHFGHKDFILCLGYRGDLIREYFINYKEYLSNDFTLSEGGRRLELHSTDIQDWRITFVDTGLHANIGQRLLKVRKHLHGEEVFLANYADGFQTFQPTRMIANCVEGLLRACPCLAGTAFNGGRNKGRLGNPCRRAQGEQFMITGVSLFCAKTSRLHRGR